MSWTAYVDESMRAGARMYILAAACLDTADCAEARLAVGALAKRGQRFHWRRSSVSVRRKAVAVVSGLPALHLVVVAAPLDPPRQERGRRHALRRLLFELHQLGVTRVVLEARTQSLNVKDIEAVDAFRAAGVISADILVQHGYPAGPSGDALLWVPDVVAGAIGGELDGGEAAAADLNRLVTRFEVELD